MACFYCTNSFKPVFIHVPYVVGYVQINYQTPIFLRKSLIKRKKNVSFDIWFLCEILRLPCDLLNLNSLWDCPPGIKCDRLLSIVPSKSGLAMILSLEFRLRSFDFTEVPIFTL